MNDAVIVGAGITGLSAAFYLEMTAREAGVPLRYEILEQNAQAGGKIRTTRENGFVVEGGPDSFLTQKPAGLQLCRELNLDNELVYSDDSRYRLFLLRGRDLVPYPDGFRLAVPTKLWPFIRSPLISPLGKARMGLDLIIPRRQCQGDESVAQFVCRRLGREAFEKIAGPIMSTIYVGDPNRMSLLATFPMFAELERKYGSLTRGILKARRRDGASRPLFASLRDGMQRLVEALTQSLSRRVQTNFRVAGLRRNSAAFDVILEDGHVLRSRSVILTVPAFEAARLVRPLNPRLALALSGIRHISSAAVSLAYRSGDLACHPAGGFGFVAQSRTNSSISAMTWSSRKLESRCDPGHELLRVFFAGAPDNDLLPVGGDQPGESARLQLSAILGITEQPLAEWTHKTLRGNPQYDVGHLDRVDEMEKLAAEIYGLHLAGCSYRGVGIPDCVKSGQAAARKILECATICSRPLR